jgi:hypothetical protein
MKCFVLLLVFAAIVFAQPDISVESDHDVLIRIDERVQALNKAIEECNARYEKMHDRIDRLEDTTSEDSHDLIQYLLLVMIGGGGGYAVLRNGKKKS